MAKLARRRLLVSLAAMMCVAVASFSAVAQSIFPGLEGDELRVALVGAYKPASVLTLAQSKDTLYARVDRVSIDDTDGVVGIYTGWFVAFTCDVDTDPACDPSQDVYHGGTGISQEHIWPRSRGAASGLAERDMHNQAPSRNAVNNARGNLPFASIPDVLVSTWYSQEVSTTTAPPVDGRRDWSKRRGSVSFEPREEVSGFVARAMFYFALMYGPEAGGAADMGFFDDMKYDLLDWHRLYPPDDEERARGERVAAYQSTSSGESAINPFAVDTSLVTRAFFPEQYVSSTGGWAAGGPVEFVVFPNPARSHATVILSTSGPVEEATVAVFDVLGRSVRVVHAGSLPSHGGEFRLDTAGLPAGVYVIRAVWEETMVSRTLVVTR